MENNIEIKHIHANVGYYNGALYFLVDNRLLVVEVGTPNFNDYGEWRIGDFSLSSQPYNPEDNEVELAPYDFESIFINEKDLRFLTILSDEDGEGEEYDKTLKEIIDEYSEEYQYSDLRGGRYKHHQYLTIFSPDNNRDKDIKYNDWLKDKTEKLSYEKIFYPILNGFKVGYLNKKA